MTEGAKFDPTIKISEKGVQMKSFFVTVFSLMVLVFASDDTDKPIILKVARMVDVEKGKVIKDATVVIIGDKIETVNPRRIPKMAVSSILVMQPLCLALWICTATSPPS